MEIEEIRAAFPAGTRVRSLPYAETSSGRAFGTPREGTVLEYPDTREGYVHVTWDGDFRGHTVQEGHTGHCFYMYRPMEEMEIIHAPVITVEDPTIPRVIPRLRVTIARNPSNYNQWNVKVENGPVPTKHEVREYIDKGIARRLGRTVWSNDLNGIVNRAIDTYGVDPQIFIDAVTQASLAKQAREATGVFERQVLDSELQIAMGSEPALIAIGDQLFSLQPKGIIKGSRAMATIKERIVGAARKQAASVKAAANLEAQAIIRNGERQLAEARKQIEIERAAISNIMTLPTWVSDNYIKVRRWDSPSYRMAVGMEIDTRIVSWHLLTTKTVYDVDDTRHKYPRYEQDVIKWITTKILDHYHSVTIWLPFDPIKGSYAYKSAKVIEADGSYSYTLPHISTGRCCMDLQGLPEKMTSIKEYRKIMAAVNRGNQEVNMMSLLTSFNTWHPDIQHQCPGNLKKLIDANTFLSSDIPEVYLIDAEHNPVAAEAKGTFNIDSLAEARRARGESLPEITLDELADGLAEVNDVVEENEEHIIVDREE